MTKRWTALAREAGLAAEHIAIGATAIGKATYAYPAYYSQAFFALSVGFERSCKLALVVQHAIENNGSFPSEKHVRKYRHNLAELLAECERMRVDGYPSSPALPCSAIHLNIIRILSDFADNVTRYYNIQVITGDPDAAKKDDPLRQWQRWVVDPILKGFCNAAAITDVIARAEFIDSIASGFTLVHHTAVDGEQLDSLVEASTQTGLTKLSTPYVRLHILQIARFIGALIGELGRRAQVNRLEDVPYLSEFYAHFSADDHYFKTRKVWSIYPSYPAS